MEIGKATVVRFANRSVSNCFRRFAKTVSRERGEASGRRAGGGRAGGVRQTSVAEERLLRRVFRIVIAVSGIVKHGRRREPCARLRKRRGTFRNFGGKGRVRDREGLCNCFELILPQGCCGNDTDRGGMTEGRGGAKKEARSRLESFGPGSREPPLRGGPDGEEKRLGRFVDSYLATASLMASAATRPEVRAQPTLAPAGESSPITPPTSSPAA